MRDGRVPEAVKLLEGSLPAVKKDSKLSFDLGWCFFSIDRFPEAQSHLARTTALRRSHPAIIDLR